MCGIFGYIGKVGRNPAALVIEGLRKLEYRGYDSAGIAGVSRGQLFCCKEVGKIDVLENQIKNNFPILEVALGHTRWATHGKPSKINAHPHFDMKKTVAIVHNGIIENHEQLREQLKKQGVVFISDTDSEVVAHLIASHYQGDILDALQKTVKQIKGAYALGVIHRDHPDTLFAIAHESPVAIGIGRDETFVSSDPQAFVNYTTDAHFIGNSEIAIIKAGECSIFDLELQSKERESEKISQNITNATKGDFEHYTLKEIYEQPTTIKKALEGRLQEEFGISNLEELTGKIDLTAVERILIVACGTSYYAGLVAAYMIEEKARISVEVDISSELRYKNPIVLPDTLTIAISQSGETADTVAAVRELKSKGAKVIAICNIEGSTLMREADATLLLRAGPEIGVCSTKAFTSQLTLISLLTLQLARVIHMNKQEGREFISFLNKLPLQVQEVLDIASHIQTVAKKYAHYDNFFFVGRNYLYPTCLEGALKLKEISYINANGYPAGEMKHGPIALINEKCPTMALCANNATFDKLKSNLQEIKARNGYIIAIANENQSLNDVADDTIIVPTTLDFFAPILTTVATQLFAYYVALERGAEIDQPRNLAKSVTVE
jgi:glucosamine--fructose-6-phosphate aminotransferase (isomerizing)